MLDINQYFFWHLANFLLLFFLLNTLLFKPLFRIFDERASLIDGSMDKARELEAQKEELLAKMDAKLSEAKEEAKSINEGLRIEGSDIQKQAMTAAQKDADEMNKKAKADLEATVSKVKESLKKEIDNFSKTIIEKMLGA